MKLEEQNVSLELSKQLKEAGCEQKSGWYWVLGEIDKYGYQIDEHGNKWGLWNRPQDYFSIRKELQISAYTVAELGEKLKRYDQQMPVWDNYSKKWLRTYKDYRIREDTEANARGEMYLYLKGEGLIK